MAIVINSKAQGVFLGAFLGLGFWSILASEGLSQAPTFETEEQAKEFVATWTSPPPADIAYVAVEAQNEMYATMAECVEAGLPAWLTEESPDAQAIPA